MKWLRTKTFRSARNSSRHSKISATEFSLCLRNSASRAKPPYKSEVDYSVEGDFTGYPEVVGYVDNLKMLRPPVINALQALIKEYPGWQITVTVTVRGHYDDLPNMGLYVRPMKLLLDYSVSIFRRKFGILITREPDPVPLTTESSAITSH